MQRPAYQPDPESVKREREALDGICHAMSEYVELFEFTHEVLTFLCSSMIDVFTIQPQAPGSGKSHPSHSL